MNSINEVVEKVRSITEDISQGKSYRYLEETYGITAKESVDFKCLTPEDLKDIRESIEYIKRERDKGIQTRKISAHLSFERGIVTYVLKELGYDIKVRPKRIDNTVIQLEYMWRSYKSGESIKNIAALFGHSYEDTKVLIAGFEKRIEKRRKTYDTRRGKFDVEEERKNLQNRLGVSDEVIDYMLKGTPIMYTAKGHRNSKGNEDNLEEDGR